MPEWTTNEILAIVKGHLVRGAEKPLSGFSIDTRTLSPGNVYLAIKGDRLDGNDFMPQAIDAGASLLIASRLPPEKRSAESPPCIVVDDTLQALHDLARFHRSRLRATFLGVTGSNGKTTTKEMLSHAFGRTSRTWATSGNFNNHIGLPLGMIGIPPETETAIIEMGMNHAGEIRLLATLARPHAAVITNVGPAHIGMLGSLENIATAKAEILEGLAPDGVAVIPADSPFLTLIKSKTKARVLSFGLAADADVRGTDLAVSPDSTDLTVVFRDKRIPLRLRLLGSHNAVNALACLGMWVAQGKPVEEGIEALGSFQPVQARMESVKTEGKRVILDCYNANPASMREAVRFLGVCKGRRVAVLGDMKELGGESEELHRRLGEEVAAAKLDVLVVVGDHAQSIAQSALQAGMAPDRVFSCSRNPEAADLLHNLLLEGDTVLMKASRGMHFEEIVKQLWPTVPIHLH